jgi:hypothetical protein
MYIGLDEDKLQSSADLIDMVRGSVADDRKRLGEKGAMDDGLLLRRAIQYLALYKGRANGTTQEKRRLRK